MSGLSCGVNPVSLRGMTQTVSLPLWLFILILLFAVVTFASHFLFPSVRWFFRKRMERAVEQLNTRLTRPIQPFKLARRYDTIQRLSYDPTVAAAIQDHARRNKIPENVAFEKARRYAREIVPSFSASVYFGFGTRAAKWIAKSFYRIRIGTTGSEALASIDDKATVVFVINHRSNMDYVLVTHLISRSSTVAYAVGEWARVWPLSWLVRAMGAYFIRRGERGALYRAVLARYVQMATEGGVTQAFFPEGGLSLTGRLGAPKLGLLSYIAASDLDEKRPIVFVPVGLNYDRVIEDQVLTRASITGERKFRPPLRTLAKGTMRLIGRILRGRFKNFGTVAVGFGQPIYLDDFRGSKDSIAELGEALMTRIAEVIPLVPVPIVARILAKGPHTRDDLIQSVQQLLDQAAQKNVAIPVRSADQLVDEALRLLKGRKILVDLDGAYSIADHAVDVMAYYAATIEHHFT